MKRTIFLIAAIFFCMGAAPRKTTWLALGDSITYLNDHPDQTGNRITKGYLTLLTERYPHVSYINQGHNGWSAVQIAAKINELGLVKADVYTVFLGTNDWWQARPLGTAEDYRNGTEPDTFFGAYRIITDKLKSLNPKARIVLVTPMQRGDFVYIRNARNNAYGSYREKNGQQLEDFANAVKAVGRQEKFPVVDLFHKSGMTQETLVRFKRLRDPATGTYRNYSYPDYVGVPFDPDKDEYPYPPDAVAMTYDGLHPSDKGYEVIADLLAKKCKKFR